MGAVLGAGIPIAIAGGAVLGAFVSSTVGAYDHFYPTQPGGNIITAIKLPDVSFGIDPGGYGRYGYLHNKYCLQVLAVGNAIKPTLGEFIVTYAQPVIDDLAMQTGLEKATLLEILSNEDLLRSIQEVRAIETMEEYKAYVSQHYSDPKLVYYNLELMSRIENLTKSNQAVVRDYFTALLNIIATDPTLSPETRELLLAEFNIGNYSAALWMANEPE